MGNNRWPKSTSLIVGRPAVAVFDRCPLKPVCCCVLGVQEASRRIDDGIGGERPFEQLDDDDDGDVASTPLVAVAASSLHPSTRCRSLVDQKLLLGFDSSVHV